jgi:Fe-coproporphyrin III synthase
MGYRDFSFSGGEPLIYPGLVDLLREAKRLGARLHLVTNGMSVSLPKFDLVWELLQTVAVSIDGGPSLHNVIRKNILSYDRAFSALRYLRDRVG